MSLPNEEVPKAQRSPSIIRESPSKAMINQDPLIAKGLQKEQYIGIFSVAVSLILVVGFFSRKVEYALLFAAALSIVLIAFFLTV